MDKETLSNYGWIVILVLILAVMLALATPFGTFVADAIKSTTQGLFDVNQSALNSTGLINIDGQSFGEGGNGGQGGAGDQGETNTLPEVGKTAEEYTWDEIKAISEAGKGDEYFNLGDTKTFPTTDGKEIVMEIVAFNADTKADGTGTAGITWLSKNVISNHVANSNNSNVGGWEQSELRSWLKNDLYNKLPADVVQAIVEVNKTYLYYDSGSKTIGTCVDNVWIPSVYEIFGGTSFETSGATYSNIFGGSGNNARIKYTNSGDKETWWLRSTDWDGSVNWWCVRYTNSGAEESSNKSNGIVLGFCT